MTDLSFNVGLRWSGTGREGTGEIQTADLALELSTARSMGGRGGGTNPEELLVCAVSSCYTATLFAVLRRAELPVDSIAVSASGTVTGFPSEARFARIVVNPTILGGDVTRQSEYEAAAGAAQDRCFIGRTLAAGVAYEVGAVELRGTIMLAPTDDQALSPADHKRPAQEDTDSLPPRAA